MSRLNHENTQQLTNRNLKCANNLRILSLLTLLLAVLFSNNINSQNLTSSNLPIVNINTSGLTITDEPKIPASMGIIWKGDGLRNSISDIFNNYNGKIAIEYRGSSSQSYPKKSYSFETKTIGMVDLSVSLLNLPAEEDWILYAPYSDKSLIRDVLVYTLGRSMGHYTPRPKYVELIVNNQYQGVYVLLEKIKRDKNRVNIAKLKTTETVEPDITGGYILKIDKETGNDNDGWWSNFLNKANVRTKYLYHYPEPDSINANQRSYIQNFIYKFELSLYNERYSGTGSYHDYINDSTFIDYFLINEFSRNVDGYRISSFMHKDKNGKLNCGPIWDYNISLGNADYYNGYSTSGFHYSTDLGSDGYQVPFWWAKLLKDPNFSNNMKCRWNNLRKNQFSNERITSIVDSLTTLLSESQVRNYQKWPIWGYYVWPNYYISSSYKEEIQWMKSWISNRLNWLDANLPGNCLSEVQENALPTILTFPNPVKKTLKIRTGNNMPKEVELKLYNCYGEELINCSKSITQNETEIDLESIPTGIYFVTLQQKGHRIYSTRIVKE